MHAHLSAPPARCDDGEHSITLPLEVTTDEGVTLPAPIDLTLIEAEQLAARLAYLLPEM